MSVNVVVTSIPADVNSSAFLTAQQNIYGAVDVSAFDILDLECVVDVVTGGIGPITIDLWTGWDLSSYNVWYKAGTFGSFSAAGNSSLRLNAGFQRYIAWAASFSSSVGSCKFDIRGIGESYAR